MTAAALSRISLTDFRSYARADLVLDAEVFDRKQLIEQVRLYAMSL